MNYGIDYGNGDSNIDPDTGIRFGVIPQNDVLEAWTDSAESDYGLPTCPKCGNEAEEYPDTMRAKDWEDEGDDYGCRGCKWTFNTDDAYGDDPLAFILDDGEYKAQQGGDDTDIFILKSPYYTYAQFCSPCAPGACHLRCPTDHNGPKAYCFDPSWFGYGDLTGEYNGQETSCPYPVYRVVDNVCIFRPVA